MPASLHFAKLMTFEPDFVHPLTYFEVCLQFAKHTEYANSQTAKLMTFEPDFVHPLTYFKVCLQFAKHTEYANSQTAKLMTFEPPTAGEPPMYNHIM